jgi:hypothetical protein
VQLETNPSVQEIPDRMFYLSCPFRHLPFGAKLVEKVSLKTSDTSMIEL